MEKKLSESRESNKRTKSSEENRNLIKRQKNKRSIKKKRNEDTNGLDEGQNILDEQKVNHKALDSSNVIVESFRNQNINKTNNHNNIKTYEDSNNYKELKMENKKTKNEILKESNESDTFSEINKDLTTPSKESKKTRKMHNKRVKLNESNGMEKTNTLINKENEKKVKRKYKAKDPFCIKGRVYGALRDPENCQPAHSDELKLVGEYKNKIFDISGRFSNSTFTGFNTNSFISCFDCTDSFVAVGLKENDLPFNIFEVKSGISRILIFDSNINVVNEFQFNYGDVINIRFSGETLIVLFGDGKLLRIIDYVKCLSAESPITEETIKSCSSKIESFNILMKDAKTTKIVHFACQNDFVVFTNGIDVYTNCGDHIRYTNLIRDIIVDNNSIYVSTVAGRAFKLSLCLKPEKDLGFKGSASRMCIENGYFLGFDEQTKCWRLCEHRKVKQGVFNGSFDGLVLFYRYLKRKLLSKQVFQVIKKENGYLFQDSDFQNTQLFIPRVKSFKDGFLFSTECGLIMRVFCK